MLNIDKFGKFEPIGLKKKKRQIILNHTSREVGDYLTSLEFRYNKKYDKIPNYIITREGEILQLLPETGYSNVFDNSIVNENSIIITLENLGWLEKKPLLNYYINWIGSIYKQEVYNKKWRDYFFWEPYDDRQFDMTVKLCNELLDNMNIRKKFVGYNTYVSHIENYPGVVTRSNFDTKFTDLSPAFNYELFSKMIDNE
jgi:N-acetyl-anhydromuramyl-L-alanine amidase AmpD